MKVNGNNAGNAYFNSFTVLSNVENSDEKKEYLVSILNFKNEVELYDFYNNKAYAQSSILSSPENYNHMSFKIIEDDKIYTIFVAPCIK